MNILVINQRDNKGGAALIPYNVFTRISNKYKTISVRFLVQRKTSSDPHVVAILPRWLRLIERLTNMITNYLGLQYIFLPLSTLSILYNVFKKKPDIILLQNIHGGYFWLPLLSILSKYFPIIWTAHDVWPIHRNSAFYIGYMNWIIPEPFPQENHYYPSIGLNTRRFLLNYKRFIYKHSQFSIVAPSKWLQDMMLKSPLTKEKQIYHILNGINIKDYNKAKSQKTLRKQYQLPEKEKILIFIAAFLDVELKGTKELIKSLNIIDKSINEKYHLICIGEDKNRFLPNFKNIKIHYTGYIEDPMIIRDYFALSDLFLYPSKSDNLPTVLIESIASGTPAIVYDIGGCPEIIQNNKNGIVIPPFNTKQFAMETLSILSSPTKLQYLRSNCKPIAKNLFDIKDMENKYLNLIYDTIKEYGKTAD